MAGAREAVALGLRPSFGLSLINCGTNDYPSRLLVCESSRDGFGPFRPNHCGQYEAGVIMTQTQFAPRPQQIFDHLPCPGCGAEMRMARNEPTNKPGYDLCIFECAWCEHRQSAIVKCE